MARGPRDWATGQVGGEQGGELLPSAGQASRHPRAQGRPTLSNMGRGGARTTGGYELLKRDWRPFDAMGFNFT